MHCYFRIIADWKQIRKITQLKKKKTDDALTWLLSNCWRVKISVMKFLMFEDSVYLFFSLSVSFFFLSFSSPPYFDRKLICCFGGVWLDLFILIVWLYPTSPVIHHFFYSDGVYIKKSDVVNTCCKICLYVKSKYFETIFLFWNSLPMRIESFLTEKKRTLGKQSNRANRYWIWQRLQAVRVGTFFVRMSL